MNLSFLQTAEAWQVALVLFLSMLLCVFLGSRYGKIRFSNSELKESSSSVNYLSGLLFFLLAITFGMGGNRFDARRSVVIEEANAIGTALLRADLFQTEQRNLLRNDFRQYLDARISYYENKTDLKAVFKADSMAQIFSASIWKRVTDLSKDPANELACRLMIPSLNEMIDITTTRKYGEMAKVPESIVWMLLILACINAFYIGYASVAKGRTDWFVEIGFCLLVSVVVLFTLDVDRPRRGFVNLDMPNKAIIELRNSFK